MPVYAKYSITDQIKSFAKSELESFKSNHSDKSFNFDLNDSHSALKLFQNNLADSIQKMLTKYFSIEDKYIWDDKNSTDKSNRSSAIKTLKTITQVFDAKHTFSKSLIH